MEMSDGDDGDGDGGSGVWIYDCIKEEKAEVTVLWHRLPLPPVSLSH